MSINATVTDITTRLSDEIIKIKAEATVTALALEAQAKLEIQSLLNTAKDELNKIDTEVSEHFASAKATLSNEIKQISVTPANTLVEQVKEEVETWVDPTKNGVVENALSKTKFGAWLVNHNWVLLIGAGVIVGVILRSL